MSLVGMFMNRTEHSDDQLIEALWDAMGEFYRGQK